jgi:hypothetical protein
MAGAPIGGKATIFDGVNAAEARRDDVGSKMRPLRSPRRSGWQWKPTK